MDSRSTLEAKASNSVWFTNLQLLGFREIDQSSPLLPTTFDHSNHKAFQQVFYFLLNLMDQNKLKNEFRDCWPILERKQEVEFRRKIVAWIKDYQKENPHDLPYTNPSLFQSPGGRKFMVFLGAFSSFVMRSLMERRKVPLLYKPTIKSKHLRKLAFTNLVTNQTNLLQEAVTCQAKLKKKEEDSRHCAKTLSDKYFEFKQELSDFDSNFAQEKKEEVVKQCVEDCSEARVILDRMKLLFQDHRANWESIMSVIDETRKKLVLDFNEIPRVLVADQDISLTYENMFLKFKASMERIITFQCPPLPVSSLNSYNSKLEFHHKLLTDVQQELKETVLQMKSNVQDLLEKSSKIDWIHSELARDFNFDEHEFDGSKALLPPTPYLFGKSKRVVEDTDVVKSLIAMESSPEIRKTEEDDMKKEPSTFLTPVSIGRVSRVIPHRNMIATETSPVLKKLSDESLVSVSAEGSSGLSSTKSPCSVPNLKSELFDGVSSPPLDQTRSKIDAYKRVLETVNSKKNNTTSGSERSNLLATWERARKSLSPKCKSTALDLSYLEGNQETKHEDDEEMGLMVTTRLDQLMLSLNLSGDSNFEASLSRLMDESEFVSPHHT